MRKLLLSTSKVMQSFWAPQCVSLKHQSQLISFGRIDTLHSGTMSRDRCGHSSSSLFYLWDPLLSSSLLPKFQCRSITPSQPMSIVIRLMLLMEMSCKFMPLKIMSSSLTIRIPNRLEHSNAIVMLNAQRLVVQNAQQLSTLYQMDLLHKYANTTKADSWSCLLPLKVYHTSSLESIISSEQSVSCWLIGLDSQLRHQGCLIQPSSPS